jgi:hypothetical protein
MKMTRANSLEEYDFNNFICSMFKDVVIYDGIAYLQCPENKFILSVGNNIAIKDSAVKGELLKIKQYKERSFTGGVRISLCTYFHDQSLSTSLIMDTMIFERYKRFITLFYAMIDKQNRYEENTNETNN